jgi:hypothetical protein
MCNAMNHSQPCDCGFGPPEGNPGDPIPHVPRGGKFQGRIHKGERKTWGDEAIRDFDVLRKGLQEISPDETIVRKTIRAYREHGFPLSKRKINRMNDEEKKDIRKLFKRLLGIRRYKIEKAKTMTIRVPLFTFSAPAVDKSKVTYEETTDFTEAQGWVISLIIPGLGMGASQEFKTQFSCIFSCRAGNIKTVFVPIRLRVNKMGIYENGVRIGDGGLRVTAEGGKTERNYKRGIKECTPEECEGYSNYLIDEFLYRDDKLGDIETSAHLLSTRKPKEISIGLNVHGLQTSLKAQISLEKRVRLEYNLPGGYDYFLYGLKKQLGIGWKISGPHKNTSHRKTYRGKPHGHSIRKNQKARSDQFHSRAVPFHQNSRGHSRSVGRSGARH